MLGYLRDRGTSEKEIRRIHTPAGIDLGPIQHSEIAVAVLAELVAVRTSGGLSGSAGVEVESQVETAIDPVCKMVVDKANPPGGTAEHESETYYFCSTGCQHSFVADPAKFL